MDSPSLAAVPATDLLADRSIPRRWAALAAARPASPALFDDERGWTTAGELEHESRSWAAAMAARGLQRGDRIVMAAAPSSALVAAHLGALRLGLVVVPVNTAYTSRELAHIVGDATPVAVVSDDARCAKLVTGLSARPLVELALGARCQKAGPADDEGELALDRCEPGDPAMLVYTSGTTGSPKGALLSHGNLLAGALAVVEAWRWTPEDRLVLALPLFHVHGLGVGVHGTLAAGASAVIRRRFAPVDIGESITRHHATMLFGVPTMYSRLTGVEELRRLRLCVSGSAPLPAGLHRELAERTGQQLLERYGMSETLMNTSNPYDGERRPGTVGLPLPGVEVRLDDLRPDGAGEVLVRGPNVFGGYLARPEATAAAFSDGWFRTGDLGSFDEDGYLHLVGRKAELVISGGYNVYPREVEDVLRCHPAVADAAVVGWPDEEWGEQVVAFVVPTGSGPATDSLVETLERLMAEQLAFYKRPKQIHLTAELPRNALGKVVKSALKPTG